MKCGVLLAMLITGCAAGHSPDRVTDGEPHGVTRSAPVITSPATGPSRMTMRAETGGLSVAETNLWPLPEPVELSLRGVWRYDPEADRWARVLKLAVPLRVVIRPARATPELGMPVRLVLEVPEQVGLYWVWWSENGREVGYFVGSGPVNCNDIDLPDPPPGKVKACVPFENSARAQFVPDPRLHCK